MFVSHLSSLLWGDASRCFFGELSFSLSRELKYRFRKEVWTKRPIPHYRRSLPSPLSFPSAKTLPARWPSRHGYFTDRKSWNEGVYIAGGRQLSTRVCGCKCSFKALMNLLLSTILKSLFISQTTHDIGQNTEKAIWIIFESRLFSTYCLRRIGFSEPTVFRV